MTNHVIRAGAALLLVLAVPAVAQLRFPTSEAAAQALVEAAERHDSARLAAILGPQAGAVLTSGNPAQDSAEQSEFARLARAKYQVLPDSRSANRALLSIGEEDWPFPVPIVRSKGQWSFDASETLAEMQARRIGTDELDVIEICAGYVEAQRKFASAVRDKDGLPKYASHALSAPGQRDGLYWEGGGEPLVPSGFAKAVWDPRNPNPKPYHGYFFRILDGQGPHAPGGAHTYRWKDRLMGGFGLLAWPSEYGMTGVQTFIVNQDGVIYGRDIAPAPGVSAPAVPRYDPDPSWQPAD